MDGRIGDHSLSSEVERIVEVLSYVVARIIVSCTGDDHLVQRYALAEAETVESRLLEEDLDFIDPSMLLQSLLSTEDDTICTALLKISAQLEMHNKLLVKLVTHLTKKES